jgi:hypothetical protein
MSGEHELRIEIKVFARRREPGFAPLGAAELDITIPIDNPTALTPEQARLMCEVALKGLREEVDLQELMMLGAAQ